MNEIQKIVGLIVCSLAITIIVIGALCSMAKIQRERIIEAQADTGTSDLAAIEQRLGVIEEVQKSEVRALNLLLSAQIKAGRLKVVRKGEDVEGKVPDSTAVVQRPVKPTVAGSNPAPAAK